MNWRFMHGVAGDLILPKKSGIYIMHTTDHTYESMIYLAKTKSFYDAAARKHDLKKIIKWIPQDEYFLHFLKNIN